VSRRKVDLLAFTGLWTVVLTGAVLIAVLGANIVALIVLWAVVLTGAVLIAALAADEDPNADDTAGAGAVAFVVSGVLTLIYVAAAGAALGIGLLAAFVGGSAVTAVYLLLRYRWRRHGFRRRGRLVGP
jgi:O-antigen/teichoic acid export membrane protein